MGVWIETETPIGNNNNLLVTPCVGVWIETVAALSYYVSKKSHPAWVCGLKHGVKLHHTHF